MKLPMNTTIQLRNSCQVVRRPLARAVRVSVEDVNSSAPVRTTRARPVENTRPPKVFATP